MKQILPLVVFTWVISFSSVAQSVGIGTNIPDSSAQLDISNASKGILIPRMKNSSILSILKPAKGLMVYDSVNNQLMVNTGTPIVPNWQTIVANSGWNLSGNIGTKPLNQFVGTNDNAPLRFRINNQWAGQVDSTTRMVALGLSAGINNNPSTVANVAIGNAALSRNTTGGFNTALGDSAGFALNGSTDGVFIGNSAGIGRSFNAGTFAVVIGAHAGDNAVAGWVTMLGNFAGASNQLIGNVMIGSEAGRHSTTGAATFIGDQAGWSNTTGSQNVYVGTRAADSSKVGSGSTAMGYEAMMKNDVGEAVFIGNLAGRATTSKGGDFAVVIGSHAADSTCAPWSTIIGNFAGRVNQSAGNVFVGSEAGRHNTTGASTFVGNNAGWSNTTGNLNTMIGSRAGFLSTIANNNTAVGFEAMRNNVSGSFNTAVGVAALTNDSIGIRNTAIGTFSQFWASSVDNTSVGYESLNQNGTGFQNTAIGTAALWNNRTGSNNTALGDSSLFNGVGLNSSFNTAIGSRALLHTTNSNFNIAMGWSAGSFFDLGSNNIFIGANADASAPFISNSIAIGTNSFVTANNQVRIGNNLTNSIGGFANWTNFSDGRFKKNIQEDVKGIDFIMKLRPVTYQLDIDGINNKLAGKTGIARTAQMKGMNDARAKEVFSGFVAQEVEQAAKETGYKFSGVDKPANENDFYGLRYSDFVAPLVKAVQELAKQNQDLKQQLIQLQGTSNNQKAQYDELLKRVEKIEAGKK